MSFVESISTIKSKTVSSFVTLLVPSGIDTKSNCLV